MTQAEDVAIADFCETGSGGTPSRAMLQYYGGAIPWVKSGELRETTIFATEEHLTEEGLKNSAAKLVPAGSLLIAMYGATVGRLAILGCDAATNQAICNIRPDPRRADTRYLFRALEAKVPELVHLASGGAQPNISQEKIRNTRIRLPPLDEQRRIAATLDKAGELREKRARSLQVAAALEQSMFREMFVGGPQRETTLGEVTDEFRYGTSEKSNEQGGRPVLRIPNISRGQINLDDLKYVDVRSVDFDRLSLRSGDLLFVRSNGNPDYIGRCALVDEELEAASGLPVSSFIFASYLIRARLRPGIALPIYVQAYLSSPEGRASLFERAKTSAGQYNINTESLASLPMPLPELTLQQEYANRLSEVRRRLSSWSASTMQIERLFLSLQHAAFSAAT